MNMEKCERHGVVREGYQILLRAEAELLFPANRPKIKTFYETMADACLSWVQEVYGERLRREFCELEGLREKSQFGIRRYRFWMRSPWEEGDLIALLCESRLTDWKNPQKGYHRISQVWDTADETMLPPDELLYRLGVRVGKKKFPFVPDGFYPQDGMLILFRNATDKTPFAEIQLPLLAKES